MQSGAHPVHFLIYFCTSSMSLCSSKQTKILLMGQWPKYLSLCEKVHAKSPHAKRFPESTFLVPLHKRNVSSPVSLRFLRVPLIIEHVSAIRNGDFKSETFVILSFHSCCGMRDYSEFVLLASAEFRLCYAESMDAHS